MSKQLRIVWLVGALLAALGMAGTASAHATLVRSDPPQGATLPIPPSTARLWFSEPLDPLFTSAELYDVYGMPIALPGPPHLAPGDRTELALPLPPILDAGTYTVVWSVLSANDGHTTRGVLIFAIGTAAPESPQLPGGVEPNAARGPDPVAVAVRALQYLGALLLAGGLAFGLLVLRPDLDAARPVASWRRVLLGAHTLLLLATIGALVAQAASASNLSVAEALGTDAPTRLLLTRWGLIWLGRMALIAALLPLVFFGSLRRPAPLWGALLVSLALLATLSLSSHAAALQSGSQAAVLVDWLHLVGVAPWAAGVLLLARLLLPGDAAGPDERRRLLRRFAPLALGSALLLALTGLYGATRHLTSPAELLSSSYGVTLGLKLLLFALALGLGSYHWRWGLGRGARARWTLAAEAALVLLVVGAAAQLAQTPPPRQAGGQIPPLRTPQPFRETTPAQDLRLTLEVDAIAVGVRTFTARVDDLQGRPASADRVLLRVRALDMEHGVQSQQMIERETGLYRAQVGTISMRGLWEAELIVRRKGREDVAATFQLDVR